MLTATQWFYLVSILLITFAGGYVPLSRKGREIRAEGFPSGQAFTSGIFLALSLTLMLPSAFHLLQKAYPNFDYPIASFIAILSMIFLLFLEHYTMHIKAKLRAIGEAADEGLSHPSIPIIMTAMIAVPSFFLGAALGVSDASAAVFIYVAIMTHKSSAGFALALQMVRSTLTRRQTLLLFSLFASSTPLGIFLGADVHQYLGSHAMLVVKGFILSLAAGTFLYMSTVHELRHAPLIEHCCHKKGFILMLCGFLLTAFVRFLIGEAHAP